jgi:hypothetical protein
VENLANWMEGNKPLVAEESEFLNVWDDLVSPRERDDYGRLDDLIRPCVTKLFDWGLLKVRTLRTNEQCETNSRQTQSKKSDDEHVIIINSFYTRMVVRCLITLMAVALLTVPITVLYKVSDMTKRLWIVCIFTGCFASILCTFTRSRNYEIFSATAAYCAVMAVFIGNV